MDTSVSLSIASVVAGFYALIFRRRLIDRAWKGFGGDRDSPLVTVAVLLGATVLIVFGVISLAREVF